MTPITSLRRVAVGVAASISGLALLSDGFAASAGTSATQFAARGTVSAAVPVQSVSLPAVALAPARRLRLALTPIFPMQPTPLCYILDNFGDPRSGNRSHEGSDMLATLGQLVYAATDGVLTQQVSADAPTAGASLSGNLLTLTASDGTYFVYAHLSAFADGLSRGSMVQQGQLIGYVGDTGNAGPGNFHLHFEIHPKGGAAVNPLPLLAIPRECSVH